MPDFEGLYYEISGQPDRPWVVLCHGMALDLENMRPLTARLENDWRVLAWDMPGHGRSIAPAKISTSAFAALLEALLDRLEIHGAKMLGFSFGGVVAQTLARRRPDLASALIAYGCFAPFHQQAPLPLALVDTAIAPYHVQSWAAIQSKFAIACADSEDGRSDAYRASQQTDKPTFLRMTRALLASFESAGDVRFDCPLLIVRGGNDSNGALLEKAASGLRIAHPEAQEIVIPGAGHCAHQDAPELLHRAISDFLIGHDIADRRQPLPRDRAGPND